jgi:hypothetical protein
MDSAAESVQGIFDFESGNADGIGNWRREREARLTAIREEWGLPVGRRARVTLAGIDRELEGLLELAGIPRMIDRRQPLELRIAGVRILSTEIEGCRVVS